MLAPIQPILEDTDHRPWPLPDSPWVMAQTWEQLLFMHWPIKPDVMRALIPNTLTLDTYDGKAWVGVVPFRMTWVHPRGVPSVPWMSFFPELNVRTYVTVNGKPGVYFFSLEASNPVAVWLARTLFKLPYFNADMTCRRHGDTTHYTSHRTHRGAAPAMFEGRYRMTAPAQFSSPGSLEAFLTERYILYTTDEVGNVYSGQIHHKQWPLQPAEADIDHNTMAASHGIHLPDTAPLLHYVEKIRVAVWPLTPLED